MASLLARSLRAAASRGAVIDVAHHTIAVRRFVTRLPCASSVVAKLSSSKRHAQSAFFATSNGGSHPTKGTAATNGASNLAAASGAASTASVNGPAINGPSTKSWNASNVIAAIASGAAVAALYQLKQTQDLYDKEHYLQEEAPKLICEKLKQVYKYQKQEPWIERDETTREAIGELLEREGNFAAGGGASGIGKSEAVQYEMGEKKEEGMAFISCREGLYNGMMVAFGLTKKVVTDSEALMVLKDGLEKYHKETAKRALVVLDDLASKQQLTTTMEDCMLAAVQGEGMYQFAFLNSNMRRYNDVAGRASGFHSRRLNVAELQPPCKEAFVKALANNKHCKKHPKLLDNLYELVGPHTRSITTILSKPTEDGVKAAIVHEADHAGFQVQKALTEGTHPVSQLLTALANQKELSSTGPVMEVEDLIKAAGIERGAHGLLKQLEDDHVVRTYHDPSSDQQIKPLLVTFNTKLAYRGFRNMQEPLPSLSKEVDSWFNVPADVDGKGETASDVPADVVGKGKTASDVPAVGGKGKPASGQS